jgi:excisionase family DNA binding protein
MMSNDTNDRVAAERPLTKAGLAEYLDVSVRQVERLMSARLIEFFRVGRSPRFTRASVAAFERRNGLDAIVFTAVPVRCAHGPSARFPFMPKPDAQFASLLPSVGSERS